jgi:tryptophan synthase alpha chain
MRKIATKFSELKKRNEGALIAYVTAGDPCPSDTPRIVRALVKGGADIIELGIPFSDPIADGPTIQAASVRALKAGTTPKVVLNMVETVKAEKHLPIVLLTYFNPIFRMGVKQFFEKASASGVNGVIVPDLPIEEAREYKGFAEKNEIDTIFLAAPTTSIERLKRIAAKTSGFLYLVSVFGVTGVRETMRTETMALIQRTAQITSIKGIPLAVGFGVSKPEHVSAVIRGGADAAIVGSAFVQTIEKKRKQTDAMLQSLEDYAHRFKDATFKEQL